MNNNPYLHYGSLMVNVCAGNVTISIFIRNGTELLDFKFDSYRKDPLEMSWR